MSPKSSTMGIKSPTNAIILTNTLPSFTQTFFCSTLSSNSSIMMLNNEGERGHPCFTPVFIPFLLVNLSKTPLAVVAPLYMSTTPSITS